MCSPTSARTPERRGLSWIRSRQLTSKVDQSREMSDDFAIAPSMPRTRKKVNNVMACFGPTGPPTLMGSSPNSIPTSVVNGKGSD